MYRYMFKVGDAARFVQRALNNYQLLSGKVVSMDMKSFKIKTMLDVIQRISNCEIKATPPREGERMTEYLVEKKNYQ